MGKQLEGDMEAFSEEVTRPWFHEETSYEQTWRRRMQREGTAALEDEGVYIPGAGRAESEADQASSLWGQARVLHGLQRVMWSHRKLIIRIVTWAGCASKRCQLQKPRQVGMMSWTMTEAWEMGRSGLAHIRWWRESRSRQKPKEGL